MTLMRAQVLERYGPPEQVLRPEQLPRPQPKPGEVLVRVHGASLNSWDWDLLAGTPMGRVIGPLKPPYKILGADIAGTVEALGQGVTALQIGARVFGDLSEAKWGGLADYVCAPASALALIPEGLSFVEAAAIPQAGGLAFQALRKFPALGPAHTVAINGAGGGVGTFAIQLAKAAGAKVVAIDRAQKREALLALGADAFIDYQAEDFSVAPDRYDLIIDMVANRPAAHYLRCLKSAGRLVAIGGTFRGLIGVALRALVSRQKTLGVLVYKVSPQGSLELATKLRPVIDSAFSLQDAAAAFRRLGDGHHVGKVMVTAS
ncbi:MAG TPA: NAD(P)-dependent alcohol dehydrogenase [Devosia sp.]|nr:NAD(P)-dependent alcohol dehydrogenase [Devosia sp.]